MIKNILIIFLLIYSFSLYSQERKPLFCFTKTKFIQVKTDSDLNDYLEFEVCNSYKKKIIGVIVAYSSFAQSKDPFGESLKNKQICRTKVSIDYYSQKIIKIYLPYKYGDYIVSDIIISKLIFSDGTSVETINGH